jgi:hypothetical protein
LDHNRPSANRWADRIRVNLKIGRLTLFYLPLGFLLTGACGFLKVASIDSLLWPFLVLFCGGILLILLAKSLRPAVVSFASGGLNGLVILFILISVMLLSLASAFCFYVIGAAGLETEEGGLLTNWLFAIYEETFFLGTDALFKCAGLPDTYCMVLAVLTFVPMHAFVYGLVTSITLFLVLARIILSTTLMISGNSDVSYSSHILWNTLVTVTS